MFKDKGEGEFYNDFVHSHDTCLKFAKSSLANGFNPESGFNMYMVYLQSTEPLRWNLQGAEGCMVEVASKKDFAPGKGRILKGTMISMGTLPISL